MNIDVTKLGMAGVAALALSALACGKSDTATGPSRTVAGVTITGAATVVEGATAQLTATAQYSDQTSTDVTNQATWASSNPAIATVSTTGLLTGRATGTVDVTATVDNLAGRRTVRVDPVRFRVGVRLTGVTALDTCDDFTQDLTNGEFAFQVRTVRADGSTTTMVETAGYPGNANNPSGVTLGRNGTRTLTDVANFTLDGAAGQFVRVEFRATEWDEQIVVFPPSIRWVPDDSMNNRLGTRTHAYSNGNFSNLGPNSITLGASGCQIRLNYDVTATQ